MQELKRELITEKGIEWRLYRFVQNVSTFSGKARKGESVTPFQRVSPGRL